MTVTSPTQPPTITHQEILTIVVVTRANRQPCVATCRHAVVWAEPNNTVHIWGVHSCRQRYDKYYRHAGVEQVTNLR